VCDLETSRMGAPYIYDISRLRVNKLTEKSSILYLLFYIFLRTGFPVYLPLR